MDSEPWMKHFLINITIGHFVNVLWDAILLVFGEENQLEVRPETYTKFEFPRI